MFREKNSPLRRARARLPTVIGQEGSFALKRCLLPANPEHQRRLPPGGSHLARAAHQDRPSPRATPHFRAIPTFGQNKRPRRHYFMVFDQIRPKRVSMSTFFYSPDHRSPQRSTPPSAPKNVSPDQELVATSRQRQGRAFPILLTPLLPNW